MRVFFFTKVPFNAKTYFSSHSSVPFSNFSIQHWCVYNYNLKKCKTEHALF